MGSMRREIFHWKIIIWNCGLVSAASAAAAGRCNNIFKKVVWLNWHIAGSDSVRARPEKLNTCGKSAYVWKYVVNPFAKSCEFFE